MQRSPLFVAPVPATDREPALLESEQLEPVSEGPRPSGVVRAEPRLHAAPSGASARSEAREFVYELKFLVGQEQSAALKHWVRSRTQPDPHGGGPHGDTYQVSSLYFDTTAFHVLGRQGSYARSKYRIRRYNQGDTVYLERKVRGQSRVFKRRSATAIDSMLRLSVSQPSTDWNGHWFHRRLLARALSAVSRVDYERLARVTDSDFGPARLTLDQGLQAWHARGLSFEAHGLGLALPAHELILELKFGVAMPLLFKQLIREFAPRMAGISKYRLACQHLGLTVPPPPPADGEAEPPLRRAL